MARYRYAAYGLVLESEVRLWPTGETSHAGAADVRVSVSSRRLDAGPRFSSASSGASLRIPDVLSLCVRDGQCIEVTPETDDGDVVGAYVAGAGLAMALTQRGSFVVHGSCVRVGSSAVCIAGPSGVGKSTIAAALRRRGHRVISDGMTAVRARPDGVVTTVDGPGWLKLWPDSLDRLGVAAAGLPRVTSLHEKRWLENEPTRCDEVEVRQVYVTAIRDQEAWGRPPPGAGLVALMRCAFLAEWLANVGVADLLVPAAQVARGLEILELSRPLEWAGLPSVVEGIEGRAART